MIILTNLIWTKQSRLAEIVWDLLIKVVHMLAAEQELIIVRKMTGLNTWGYAGVGACSQGSGKEQRGRCLLLKMPFWTAVGQENLGTWEKWYPFTYSLLSTPSSTSLSSLVDLDICLQLLMLVFQRSPLLALPHWLTPAHQISTVSVLPCLKDLIVSFLSMMVYLHNSIN